MTNAQTIAARRALLAFPGVRVRMARTQDGETITPYVGQVAGAAVAVLASSQPDDIMRALAASIGAMPD